ncbi:hypothetical protein R70006_04948 [Paraburkholderia domus]|uniref:hypothetical protein n=1 Tax=Paraburkholderia domus TaxID=2793075 RepID=UPI00191125B4|nr:hypothetical protein [Paraburkholderia domus]MBK5051816.1 hypothetical protein [Burkholderia sp. R-70006]CAE6793262.1 hypothetical protein R70006_04948 [Paraburkholderia domus]
MTYFYGKATIHPVFLDELRRCGVEFARPDEVLARQSEADAVHLRIRYPSTVHGEVLQLSAYSSAEIRIDALPVDADGRIAEAVAGGAAQRHAALAYFHEYGLEAATTDAQRDGHRRALDRLGSAWSRSIRQTVREAISEPVGESGHDVVSDPGSLP